MPNTATLLAQQKKAGVTPSVVVPKSAVTSVAKSTGVDLTTKTALPGSGLPNAAPTFQSAPGSGLPLSPGMKGYVPTAPSVSSTDPDYKLQGSGNPVYNSKEELDAGLAAGKFSQSQYDASIKSLQLGGQGVDPTGFGGAKMSGVDETGTPIKNAEGPGIPQPKTAALPIVKPPTLKQARTDELNSLKGYINIPKYDKDGNIIGYDQQEDPTKTAELRAAKQKSWDDADKLAQTSQQNKATKIQQAGGAPTATPATPTTTAPIKGPDFAQFDNHASVINGMIAADPVLASTYTPILMDLIAKRATLENDHNTAMTEFSGQDKNNNGVADGVEAQVASSMTAIEKRTAESDRINKENRDINLEAANISKELAEIAQKKFDLEQHRNEQLQVENNVEMERKNRLIANKLGIVTDGNGLRWMADEIRKGVEALTYLKQSGNLQDASFALQIGSKYVNDVKAATNGYDATKLQIDTNFANEISNLNSIVTLDAKERRAEKKSLIKDHLAALDANDTKFAEQVKEFNKTLQDNIVAKDKEKKDGMMSTKDKLGFVNSLRSGINQNKTITQANDVDGFYGAVNAGYSRYEQILKEIASGELDPKAGDVAMGPAQSAIIGSLARILDPGSVVRNEEYERQTQGASFVNRVNGYFEKLKGGGAGVTSTDIKEMKILADKLHESWETRLQSSLQPFILDVQDWNANYPDAKIDFAQVIPVARVHLPTATTDTWKTQAGWETPQDTGSKGAPLQGFNTSGGPSAGWRTDRHNNPIAFAVKAGGSNEFTDALDSAGIAWEHGDAFPNNPSMVTVKVLGDPVEGARAVLENSKALQNWYLGPRPYQKELAKFGIKNNEDFKALPIEKQNEVIVAIYKGEVGNGSLVASIMPNASQPEEDNPFVPKAVAAEYDDIHFNDIGEDDPVVVKPTVPQRGLDLNKNGPKVAGLYKPTPAKKYKNIETGAIVKVGEGQKDPYASRSYQFTPIS